MRWWDQRYFKTSQLMRSKQPFALSVRPRQEEQTKPSKDPATSGRGLVSMLISMFNKSWSENKVPEQWRVADIRPTPRGLNDLHKNESYRPITLTSETKVLEQWRVSGSRPIPKGLNDLHKNESHRSISLTSSVGKTMERPVTNCLRYSSESMHLLTEYQSGLRHGLGTQGQLLRLSQSISDGLQQSQIQHTVLALIDFSSTHDNVWRDALLVKLSPKGIPSQMVR